MKKIFQIFKDDVRGVTTNFFALVIALGICALPSLYAWFNIYSNWDPYANTQNVPIAVVSDDKGFTKDDGTYVNMGENVIESLRSNDKLGWTFTDTSDEAIDGVYSGEYYAAIVLPEDFSESMYDCLSKNMEHPKIKYYENEKRNAIAVKITDSGSSSLQGNINREFIDVLVTTLSENIEDFNDSKDGSLISEVEKKLTNVRDNIQGYGDLLESFAECNDQLANTVLDIKEVLPKLTAALNSGLGTIHQTQVSVNQAATDTNYLIGNSLNAMAVGITNTHNYMNLARAEANKGENANPEEIQKNLQNVSTELSKTESEAKKISDLCDSAQKVNIPGAGDDYKQTIKDIQNIANTVATTANTANKVVSTASDATKKVGSTGSSGKLAEVNRKLLSAAMDDAVKALPKANEKIYADLSQKVQNTAKDVNNTVGSAAAPMKTGLEDVESMDTVFDGVNLTLLAGNQALLGSKYILDTTTNKLNDYIDKLQSVTDEEKVQNLMDTVKNDPTMYGAFFSQPIEVENIIVYETKTYGSAVTPFYTTLALWVGGILLVAVFKVKAKGKNGYKDASLAQLYLGRYLLFFVMGQIQAFIVVFGDLNFLGVQCEDPKLFYFIGAIASFVFTLLIYTLTLSFGDVGKAIVVVVMVMQIAGSSGTYPIELLPDIFQKIYTYFPFPYAINTMREVISGRYMDDYWTYTGQLMIFAAIALVVGLFIRIPFMGINHFFEERMEDTKMM